MRIALLTGLGAGIVCGFFLFAGMTGMVAAGGLLYYSPLLIYFAAIYFSIKRNNTVNHNGQIEFKQALKYGGLTAIITCLGIWIGVFVALTHTDVHAQLNAMIESKMSKQDIDLILGNMNRQKMFDNAKAFTMTYFLLGFPLIIGTTVVVRAFGAKKAGS